jgi:NAD(P)-dependent dehydrogenase (short-subunit alcohol dehydrogenase family)
MAQALAARGMSLAIHHHASAEGAEELRQEIVRAGGRAACFGADLADAAAARALPERVVAQWGRLDVLVNSAAIMRRLRLEETTPEEWDAVHHLNLRAVFFCTQGAAPAL